jgi:putative membrane protein
MGILLLVAVGLIVYLVVRNETKKRDSDTRETDTPLEIAKRRYARGEITKKEFEQLKKDLS